MNDAAKEFLLKRGCPKKVVEGGLAGLLDSWEKTIGQIEKDYQFGLDDYLDDLDVRQIIHDLPVPIEPALALRLRALDERFRHSTGEATACIWGEQAAREEGWTRTSNWWYFRIPLDPGKDLEIELLQVGLSLKDDPFNA